MTAAAVELPPMLVEESVTSTPWFYVNAGGVEFLSRCSAYTTRRLAEAWLAKMQLVHVLVPKEFLVEMEVPSVFVLYSQSGSHAMSAEIQKELTAGAPPPQTPRLGEPPRTEGVSVAPSMRLSDRDMHASIAYIDEALFDASTMSISPNHVRYLLRNRVPELPLWLMDGVERTLRTTDFIEAPITLGPLVWLDSSETAALGWDATRPRALLTANELFSGGAIRAAESKHPRRMAVRAATEELFFRWALVSGADTRAAFWKFAARAAEQPVTEEMFEAYFGFDFAELRDRLSDFLVKEVDDTAWISPGKPSPLPPIEIERATPNQIARVRGEWERLAIGHVQRRLPQVREPYIAQARRTLHRAYDTGDRDPRLLATMGLCEIDAGNPDGALEFLEQATALGVVRPRAYYELARLRFTTLLQKSPDKARFAFGELAPVIGPLQKAIKQAPPLAEAFALLGEAWAACEMGPNAAEFAELEAGARLFVRNSTVGHPIALAMVRHGRKTEAAAVVEAYVPYAADEKARAGIAQVHAELAKPAAPP